MDLSKLIVMLVTSLTKLMGIMEDLRVLLNMAKFRNRFFLFYIHFS